MSVESNVVNILRSRMEKITGYFNWQAQNGRFPNSPDFYTYVSLADPNNPVTVVKYLNELDTASLKIQYGAATDYNGLTFIKKLSVDLKNPKNNSTLSSINIHIVEPYANNLIDYNAASTEETPEVNYFMFLPIPGVNKTLAQITDELTVLDNEYPNTYGKIKTYSFEISIFK